MEAHFATVWEHLADDQPDAMALAQGARELRWGEYDERASRMAAALLAAGVGPGDTVALYLRNAIEYAELTYAALKIRAIPLNVNYRYLGDELLELLADSQAKVVAFHTDLADRIAAVADRAPHVHLWIQVDPPEGPHQAMTTLIRRRGVAAVAVWLSARLCTTRCWGRTSLPPGSPATGMTGGCSTPAGPPDGRAAWSIGSRRW